MNYKKLNAGIPYGTVYKNLPAKARDTSSVPGLGRSIHAMEQQSPCSLKY